VTVNRRQYLRGSGLVVTTGLAGLAGCSGGSGSGSDAETDSGSSEGGDSETDSGSGTVTGSSSGGTFTIGATLPETGVFSSLGQDLARGYEMGVQRINDNGGLHGQEVELIVRDDESTPKKVREGLQSIISNNDVDMLWGSFAGVLNLAAAAVAERAAVPLLKIASSGDKVHEQQEFEWTSTPFPVSTDHTRGTKNALDLIPESERPSKVAIWAPNTNWSIEMADMWEQTLTEGGYDVVFRGKHQLHSKDFTTLISETQSAGAEVLLDTPAPDGGITAMQQINNSDFSPKLVQFTRAADTSSWWSAMGEAGENVLMSPGWVPGLTGNGNEQMTQTYRETYDVASDELLPVMVGASYNLTQVAEQAVNAAESTDRPAVRDAIRSGSYETVSGSFSFDEYGRPVDFTTPMGQWLDGNQHLVYPETDGEAFREMVYPMS